MSLRTLEDTHFEVDAVTYNIDFSRLKLIEEVTIVPVFITHSVIIFSQALVEELLIIHISLSHTEDMSEVISGIDGITHPCDVAEIVFLSFLHLHIYIDMLLVEGGDAIFEYHGIAVTELVILLDKVFLSLLISLGSEFL